MTHDESFHLSAEQKAQFDRDGFIGPFTLIEPDAMNDLWPRMRYALLDRKKAAYPDSKLNYDRHLDIQELSDLASSPRIVHRLQSILGDDLLCWRTEWFPKYPGDEGTEWHQAKTFFEFEGSPRLKATKPELGLWGLTVWTAFTETTRENGCMKLMPGTHNTWYFDESRDVKHDTSIVNQRVVDDKKQGFFGYNWEKLKVDPGWKPDESKAFHLEMKPGQFFIFSSQCLHASEPNRTRDFMRCGWSSRYVATHVKVYSGHDSITSLGETLPLDRYSTVLVGGHDAYGHNVVSRPLA
jgi:non-heme Fe2+,alpha-ketoglutarate-dependent halogenase